MKKGLQGLLVLMGVVMIGAGLQAVIGGAGTVFQPDVHSTNVDTEFRFYGAWYAGAGAVLLHGISKIEDAVFEVRLVGATFFLAAIGRVLSLLEEGRPHGYYLVLMAIEFVIPLAIVPWQARVARQRTNR